MARTRKRIDRVLALYSIEKKDMMTYQEIIEGLAFHFEEPPEDLVRSKVSSLLYYMKRDKLLDREDWGQYRIVNPNSGKRALDKVKRHVESRHIPE